MRWRWPPAARSWCSRGQTHQADAAAGRFRSGTVSAASAIGLLVNVAFYGLIFVFSLLLFFQRAQHLSALQTAQAFASMTAAIMAANVLAGRAAGRFGPRRVILAGALLMAGGRRGPARLPDRRPRRARVRPAPGPGDLGRPGRDRRRAHHRHNQGHLMTDADFAHPECIPVKTSAPLAARPRRWI